MSARWSFVAFDWNRFHVLEPSLRSAGESGNFDALSLEGAETLLDAIDLEAPSTDICNALLTALFTLGDPLVFETGLPELIRWLRTQTEGEEAAELLGILIGGAPNVEAWFLSDVGLAGVLNEAQTRDLAQACARFRRVYRPDVSQKPERRMVSWIRRFLPIEPAPDLLHNLLLMIEEVNAQSYGLAVLLER